MRAVALLVALVAGGGLATFFLEGERRPTACGAAKRASPRAAHVGPPLDAATPPISALASASAATAAPSACEPTGADSEVAPVASGDGAPVASGDVERAWALDLVEGRVVDGDFVPVAGARVQLVWVRSRDDDGLRPAQLALLPVEQRLDAANGTRLDVLGCAVSGGDGHFAVAPLVSSVSGSGAVAVLARVDRPGGTYAARVSLEAEDDRFVLRPDVVLRRLLRITVVARSAAGELLDGVTVRVDHTLGFGDIDAELAVEGPTRSGVFEVLASPSRGVRVRGRLSGRASGYRYLDATDDVTAELVLGVEAKVTGRVVGPDGAALAAAKVDADANYSLAETSTPDDDHRYEAASVRTGEDGSFVLEGLQQGATYTITADAGDHEDLLTECAEVVAPGNAGDLRLGRGGVLSVVAHREEPLPEGGFTSLLLEHFRDELQQWIHESSASGTVTTATLSESFTHLAPGSYRVSAFARSVAAGRSRVVQVSPGERVEVAIALETRRAVHGRLLLPDGQGDSSFDVMLDDDSLGPTRCSVNGTGDFLVPFVPLDDAVLRFTDGSESGTYRVRIPPLATELGELHVR